MLARMSSLAFKMEKVYNLDKKKGPASEVYKFFKNLEQKNQDIILREIA